MVSDAIERVVVLRHPIEQVWAALTTAEGLSGLFGSPAEIDLRPGGRVFFRWRGPPRCGRLTQTGRSSRCSRR
jgi:uncharacterized protein YndB with AHSA1/START domain